MLSRPKISRLAARHAQRLICSRTRGTSYDGEQIAQDFVDFRNNSWYSRWEREKLTLLTDTVALTGKDVLDLACGDGTYSRLYRDAGAARVVGVDLSADIVEIARAQESEDVLQRQRGCVDYVVGDAARLAHLELGEFDAISAMWLINYFGDDDELTAVLRQIATALRPRGTFFGTTEPPDGRDSTNAEWERLGVRLTLGTRPGGGGTAMSGLPMTKELQTFAPAGSRVVRLDVFWRDKAHLARLFGAAGFSQLEWLSPSVPDWVQSASGEADPEKTLAGFFIARA